MILRSTRDVFAPGFTLSTLRINGRPFGYVCEDFDRALTADDTPEHIAAVKVHGRTAIPTGCYRVGLRDSPKHGPNTLYLRDVPGFQFIDVHAGNSAADTEGCQLVGLTRDEVAGTVGESRLALEELRAVVVPAVGVEDVWWVVERG
jgi:hypothetical protein